MSLYLSSAFIAPLLQHQSMAGTTMKLILALSVAFALGSATSGFAFAGQCPANATYASRAIWRDGEIPHNSTRTAIHHCGKRITCTGGDLKRNAKRSCSWG
jgi:H+/gluconate symporter-like permease